MIKEDSLNEVQQMQIDLEISLENMQKKVDRTHKRLTEIFTVWALEQQKMPACLLRKYKMPIAKVAGCLGG